jgi:hypothetical protein
MEEGRMKNKKQTFSLQPKAPSTKCEIFIFMRALNLKQKLHLPCKLSRKLNLFIDLGC